MRRRGGDAPPPDGGEFLLQLLRGLPHSMAPFVSRPHYVSQDPSVAAVGPSFPSYPPTNGGNVPFPPWSHLPPPQFAPQNHFHQNPYPNLNLNPSFLFPGQGINYNPAPFILQSNSTFSGDDAVSLGFYGNNSKPTAASPGHNIIFGSLNRGVLKNGGNAVYQSESSFEVPTLRVHKQERSRDSNDRMKQRGRETHGAVAPPSGLSSNSKSVRHVVHDNEGKTSSVLNGDKSKASSGLIYKKDGLSNQLDLSASVSEIQESMKELHVDYKVNNDVSEKDDMEDQVLDSQGTEVESSERGDKKKYQDYRSDNRGQWIMSQRVRNLRRQTTCRNDVNKFNAPLLALFESLIPSDEEKVKQKQLLMQLEKLIQEEWPDARLLLYGSRANSFGFSKSDIDVCLRMDLAGTDKPGVLLKLASIFEKNNLQNVQALTRARVPIVKLTDPVTGIACDICINNMLAVANTKLLFDYAQIDVRLRQLAFIVKHWAKSRGVNVTYQGTLSSYAYVLMCIHLLQQRRPPILPCLQRMQITHFSTIDGIECGYFDQVEKLERSQNGESIAQLLWAFFHYWAYCHDYANDVISVRTGSRLSKGSKEWKRRVGKDRHLICIEDPFETSHDLGRIVHKYSIRVLREEFERAAQIMQYDPNPCLTLFQPYIPN